MSAPVWYCSVSGKTSGPYSLCQVREFVTGGLLGPSDLVWQEGTEGWVPALSLPDIVAEESPQLAPAPSNNDEGLWYYARDRQRCDPVPLAEICRLVDAGELRNDDMALRVGESRWVTIESVLGAPPDAGPAATNTENTLPEVPLSEIPTVTMSQPPAQPLTPWWRRWKLPVGGTTMAAVIAGGMWYTQNNQRRGRERLKQQQELLRQQQRPRPVTGPLQPGRVLGSKGCVKCLGTGKAGFAPCPVCEGRGWIPPPPP